MTDWPYQHNITEDDWPAVEVFNLQEGYPKMKVLGCGGRDFHYYETICKALDEIRPTELIHGAAKGADSLVGRYANEHNIPCQEFPAQWEHYGKSAGFRRNEAMLLISKPDLVIAFPGGKGTAHMVATARNHGYPVRLIETEKE